MSAAILCIGTELVRGEVLNTNASHIAERLAALGFEITFGLPESTASERLAGIESLHRVTLGYRVRFSELEIKLLARGQAKEDAGARHAADEVGERLGSEVVRGQADADFAGVIGQILRESGPTPALAESCDRGRVAALLTDAPGASDYLSGSAVTCANTARRQLLGVPEVLLERRGAASAEVAMAEEARRIFGASRALALTGIAGPAGGSEARPVGLVYCGLAAQADSTSRRGTAHGSRQRIRRMAAFRGLATLRQGLLFGWPRDAA